MRKLTRRIVSLLLAVMTALAMLPMNVMAAEDWIKDDTAKTVSIYTAKGLRDWASSITNDKTSYNGYTISIENDIDLSGANWNSIIGLGGTVVIDGKDHTISNMSVSEKATQSNGTNTYLGFIGDINYNTRLTVKDITFENAHVQDPGGDSEYSWCGVVVGHGPMDLLKDYNADCTFRNVNIINSVVTGGHNNGAILGYASSTPEGHVFEGCNIVDTFVGGYESTSGILMGMGIASVTVKDCTADGVRLYTDGLNFNCSQSVMQQLWVGHNYESRHPLGQTIQLTDNELNDTYAVYPVYFHYNDQTVKQYVPVNTEFDLLEGQLFKAAWYSSKEDQTEDTAVNQIIAANDAHATDMYPYGKHPAGNPWGNPGLVNDEPYETQNTDEVANPLTHGAIELYTNEYMPDKTSYPGLEKYIIDQNGSEIKKDSINAGDSVKYELKSNVPQDLTNYLEPDEVASPSVAKRKSGISLFAFEDELNSGVYYLTFHDELDPELTRDEGSISVTVNGKAVPSEAYELNENPSDDCTFELTLNLVDLYEMGYFTQADFGIASAVVTYTATAASDLSAGAHKNTAWVEYEGGETEEDVVEVDTYGIDVFKYDQSKASSSDASGLGGARFELRDGEGNLITTLTSGKNGHVTLEGLRAGKYILTETEAPSGFVKSDEPLTIILPDDADKETYFAHFNFANAEVPHTGGSGTRVFTIIGAAIVIAAGALFVGFRKKEE